MPPPKKPNGSGRTQYVRGDVLKAVCIMKGFGLEQLRKRMGNPKIALATIKKAENGGPCYLSTIKRICEALECDLETIILLNTQNNETSQMSKNNENELVQLKFAITIYKDSIAKAPIIITILNMLNDLLSDKEGARILSVDPVPVPQSPLVIYRTSNQQQCQLQVEQRYGNFNADQFGYIVKECYDLDSDISEIFITTVGFQNSKSSRGNRVSLLDKFETQLASTEGVKLQKFKYDNIDREDVNMLIECGVKWCYEGGR